MAPARTDGVLEGVVSDVVVRKDDGWSVVIVDTPEGDRKMTGTFRVKPVRGEVVQAQGRWKSDPRFGDSFVVDHAEFKPPQTAAGLRRYLQQTLTGVGFATADRIIAAFGVDAETALADPARLVDEAGLSVDVAEMVAYQWRAVEKERGADILLRDLGLGPKQSAKVIEHFGVGRVVEAIRKDPYVLTGINGIGFEIADAAARKLGLEADSPSRIRSGVRYSMEKRAQDGHTAATQDELVAHASKLLAVEQAAVVRQLPFMVKDSSLVRRDPSAAPATPLAGFAAPAADSLYLLPQIDAAERSVAHDIARILAQPRKKVEIPAREALQDRFGIASIDDSQYAAIKSALNEGFSVITGGPGTGKTTMLRIILELHRELHATDGGICSPTGKAAKRVTQATGEPALTIHRYIGVMPKDDGGFRFIHNRDNKLDMRGELAVMEEASMTDLFLASSLLQAIPDGCPVLVMGDANQLASVGPGNFLADCIRAGVPTAKLTTLHRTDEGSMIPVVANQILHGEMPTLTNKGPVRGVRGTSAGAVVGEVKRLLAEGAALDDVGVLAPMKKTEMGADWLNICLQRELNGSSVEHESIFSGRQIATPGGAKVPERFGVGDRVMQVKNDYDLDVYNGDSFEVTAISPKGASERWMELRSLDDDRRLRIPSDKINKLNLAYAITIHKSQGSEYKNVVLSVARSHYRMLTRRLLFTGATRARDTLSFVGESEAIRLACQNVGESLARRTGLRPLIENMVEKAREVVREQAARVASLESARAERAARTAQASRLPLRVEAGASR